MKATVVLTCEGGAPCAGTLKLTETGLPTIWSPAKRRNGACDAVASSPAGSGAGRRALALWLWPIELLGEFDCSQLDQCASLDRLVLAVT